MNRIQERLVRRLFNAVKEKYPEIEFLSVENSPEDPDDLIVNILISYDEDTEIELTRYAASISTDILMEYDYLIGIIPMREEYADETGSNHGDSTLTKQPEKLLHSKKMNRIQEKLVRRLFHTVKEKYPDIQFLNVENSPEDPEDLILNVLVNCDEDTEIEIKRYAASIATDILMDYDYLIFFLTVPKEYEHEYRIEPRRFNINEAA